ncbi:flagellar hook capping FlgD N-terminal domain-containing protein [Bacillus sp. N9]
MKILMVQLQNQDPMNPMEDKEFITQMATFSSLEQMTNISQLMGKMVELQTQTSLIAYHQFIGKEVRWHTLGDHTESGEVSVNEGKGL